mmetsp:Transcript_8263/g.9191  ORF Transcript_8263/g.9191 Transcript_8263/m.9191 type:complete len:372 (+) Transcript_8263:983-2098(+)
MRLHVFSGCKRLGFATLCPRAATSQSKYFWIDIKGPQGGFPVSGSIKLQIQFKAGIHDLKTIAVSKKQDKAVVQLDKTTLFLGEQIEGTATFQLNSTDVEKLISCRIAFIGVQHVSWSDGKQTYSKTKTILDQTLYNITQLDSVFVPGVQTVTFSQPIPFDMPPTFAFKDLDASGWTRYSVNLYLKRKRAVGTSLKTIKIPVILKRCMLAQEKPVPNVYQRSDSISVRKNQRRKLKVSFDKKFIVPGQSINTRICLFNSTEYTATSLQVVLNTVRIMKSCKSYESAWTQNIQTKKLWKNKTKCHCEPGQTVNLCLCIKLPKSCSVPTIDTPKSPLVVKYNVRVVVNFKELLVSNMDTIAPITVLQNEPNKD